MTVLFEISAITLYLLAATYQGAFLLNLAKQPQKTLLLGLSALALLCHGISLFSRPIDLGLLNISSLFFWFIALLALLSTLRRPTYNLLVVLLPLAALAIAAGMSNTTAQPLQSHLSKGMLSHILSSILAYSVLTIAMFQAIALSIQDHQLKQHHVKGIIRALPPLQTMEAMLFELLWIGVVLLSISILSGIVFLEDIFAQHLIHKTALSIAAWCIFSTLLWGHWQLGWRSQTAVRWTIGGFIALMLGYFGSKFVLEIILQ
ncbi:cytochrome C assembly family protein [Dasania marina]|uniref:cytochrome C assembly family protein n=1 Tax=Dasania marina TaxID=471499 RepID=UPI00036EC733|nr:cytochrome c biogenesis protein CcsA [Dasania marina]